MMNDTDKLLIIHEFPRPNMQPFLNPICKDTFDSLPRIYGRKGKKKYFLDIQEYIKNQNSPSCARDCCRLQYQEQNRPSTDVKIPKNIKLNAIVPSQQSDNCLNKNCVCHSNSKNNQKQTISPIKLSTPNAKLKKIILPNLKEFDCLEITQAESKHKVIRATGSMSFSQPKLVDSTKIQTKILTHNRSHLKSSRISQKSTYTQTGQIRPESNPLLQNQKIKISRFDTQNSSENKRYYQYLQNDLRMKENTTNYHLKMTQTSDQSYSISSSFAPNDKKQLSTVFHQYKKKQQLRKQNADTNVDKKHSKAYSVLSNGLFKIPEEEQLQDFLLNYKPLDPSFNVKQLAKQKDFYVVPSKGKVYFGQVQNDKKHGSGITVSQKDIYEGKYQNNLRVYGSQKNRDGVYTGQFVKGKRHGQGKFVWVNGQEFEGEWKNGKKNGHGIWRSPKGDYYEGQWKQNRQNGKGYYFHKGGSKYNGYFKDFLKEGKGQQQFPSGDRYTGEYKNGKPHGYGKYVWSNGDTYQGDFIEGSRQGKGQLKKINGEIYEGQFHNDMKHGLGKQKYKSGQTFSGQFKQGARFKGTLLMVSGKSIEVNGR